MSGYLSSISHVCQSFPMSVIHCSILSKGTYCPTDRSTSLSTSKCVPFVKMCPLRQNVSLHFTLFIPLSNMLCLLFPVELNRASTLGSLDTQIDTQFCHYFLACIGHLGLWRFWCLFVCKKRSNNALKSYSTIVLIT